MPYSSDAEAIDSVANIDREIILQHGGVGSCPLVAEHPRSADGDSLGDVHRIEWALRQCDDVTTHGGGMCLL